MKKILFVPAVLIACLLISGCATGLVYTHTLQPLTLDMNRTGIVSTSAESDIRHIQVHVVGVAWGNAAIGDVARTHGIKELSFADLEIMSVLRIWNQYTLHLYGK